MSFFFFRVGWGWGGGGVNKGWFGIVRKKEKREIYGVKVLLVGKGRAWFGIIVRKKKREKYMVLGTVWTVKQ